VVTVEQAYIAKVRAVEVPPARAPASAPVAAPTPSRPLRARPPVQPEPGILGFSRYTRGRRGSRLFTLFFVCVYALILVQLIVTLLQP